MRAMSDRLFMALIAATAVAMIGVASVWPQGLGARSPGPIGHTPLQQTPAMQSIIERQAAQGGARHQAEAREAAVQLRRALGAEASASSAPDRSGATPSDDPGDLRPGQ
jgi:hypothetical protein